MFARSIVGSLPYFSAAFLLAGMYLLGVSARVLRGAGASIAVGVGWVYIVVGALGAIAWVVM